MEMATSEMNTVLQRLDAMEVQNRWLKRGGLAILTIVAGMISFVANAVSAGNRPQASSQAIAAPMLGDTLDAQRIVLRDAGGKVRCRIEALSGAAELAFFDDAGLNRLTLGLQAGACGLSITDGRGKQRIALDASDGDGHDRACLYINDASGRRRGMFGHNQYGAFMLISDAPQKAFQGFTVP